MVKKINWWKVAIAAFYTVFFGVLLVTGEPMYLGDSYQHENQFITREPVYALLIQLLKAVVPNMYFNILIVFQCILAVVCYSTFTFFLEKAYSLKKWGTGICVVLLLMPHIVTPIAAKSNMVITNSIMTEGISYSLFLLFLIPTLKMINEEKPSAGNIIISALLGLLLSLVRGQLMTLLIVWLIASALKVAALKKYKQVVFIFISFILLFVGRGYIVKTYNYLENGIFTNTVSSKAMSIANILYVCDREDGEVIDDDELRNIFYVIYDEANENGANYKYSPDGLINRARHHENYHEDLNFEYFNINVRDYISEKTGVTAQDFQRLMIEIDKVAAVYQGYLLPKVLPRYVYNYLAMISMGFVRSVAFVHPVLNIYSIVIYLVAIVLCISLFWKNRNSKSAKLMALTLLMIVGNVTATSFYLECVSRYMIYQFPIFYISLGLMILELLRGRKKNGI